MRQNKNIGILINLIKRIINIFYIYILYFDHFKNWRENLLTSYFSFSYRAFKLIFSNIF